ncbi:hypothetical protein Tco_1243158 [Tanacetum coccineum]
MQFLLATLNVAYVLTKPSPGESENETLVESRECLKFGNDDFICRGHIFNAMLDPLFNVYQNYPTARELWKALEGRYFTKDATNVKKNLKHHKDDLSMKDLGKHLLIEEQYYLENKANDDTSKITDQEEYTSTSRWIFTLGGGAVSWGSKKQSCLTNSTKNVTDIRTYSKENIGRPEKKRNRASHKNNSFTKISRAGISMTRHNCGEPGHNKKGCKNPTIPKPAKVKGKAGRPKKSVATENINVADDEDILSYFVKMRGGKSSRGGLVPAERLGKIDRWLGVDVASSDLIEDTQPFQRSHVATNFNQNDATIIHGTQKSQVVKGLA